jgi:LPS-assembly protein
VGVFSVDSGLIFERPVRLLGGLNMLQTLEPRLFYLYSAHVDQQHLPTFDTAQLNFSFNQLFREDRFSGADRIGDANQFSAALTTRFITDEGSEQLRLSVGQIFYFQDRQVSLDSPLQSWLLLQPHGHGPLGHSSWKPHTNPKQTWQLLADLQWDQEKSNIDQGQYRPAVARRQRPDPEYGLPLPRENRCIPGRTAYCSIPVSGRRTSPASGR